ncbi:orexin receptor type 2 [Elysia marginata]|uniref:Orexin receptor type 2 n=1 Tax=Elysia marginata TaxID=1093978 RepID=A0AAV4HU21_9GAST|nr:orexin receptor type 2 [Elysia marginata]
MAVQGTIKTTLSTFVQNVVVAIEEEIRQPGTGRQPPAIGGPLNLLAGNASDSVGVLGSDRVSPGSAPSSPGANGTGAEDGEVYEGIKREHIIAVSVMLTCFSIFGILGNGLVLYVFSRKSDRVTSTIFILALAWTDFFTCLVIMPFTVTNLQLDNHLTYNGFCKLFQFFITFMVPLSTFIMVAIAVDRYFSICHPFSHMITPKRAKISILCLLIFAIILAFITSLMYSTYTTMDVTETAEWCLNSTVDLLPLPSPSNGSSYRASVLTSSYSSPTSMIISPSPITTQPTQRSLYANSLVEIIVNQSASEPTARSSDTRPLSAENCTRTVQKTVYAGGACVETERIFSIWFMDLYQKIFISFYIISLLSVFVLYFFIYRSVAQRRKWRRRQKSCTHSPMTNTCAPQEDTGVTPDKVAALNNRGSVRSALDNGGGQAGAESYSLKPWSHCSSTSHSNPTTSSSALTDATASSKELSEDQESNAAQQETVRLVVTSSSQSNNNGKRQGPELADEIGSANEKSPGNNQTVVNRSGCESSLSPPSAGSNNQRKHINGNADVVEKADDGHENGVSKRLTLNIPSATPTAADKKSSRERRDFNFLANIRTAMMLFVVTLVFTACFMPAWLMAAQLLHFQPIIFYSHFLYNVANPVIYAFMNQSFRKELKRVFQRGTNLFRS